MSIFVDASALVAIIAGEPERERFRTAIYADDDCLWSPMSCWETISAVRKMGELEGAEARAMVTRVVAELPLRLVSIGQSELDAALEAYQKYGRGSRHPAKLNFGDCFAYACAKTNGARLLYKGNDFSRTDLA